MSLPCLFHASECFPWKITLKVWKRTPKHFHLFGPWITLEPPRRPAREPKSLHDPSSALAKAVRLTLWSDVLRPSFQSLIIVKDLPKFRRWCADDTCWTSNSSGVWKLEMYVMFESHPKNVCKSTGHASGQKLHMFKKSSNILYVFRPIGEKAALWFHVTKVWGSPCWLRAIHSYIINMIPNSEASHALHPHGQNVPIKSQRWSKAGADFAPVAPFKPSPNSQIL